jgi:hypothetical protein
MAMPAVRFAVGRLTGQQQQAILRSALANEQEVLNGGGFVLRRLTSFEASAGKGPKVVNTQVLGLLCITIDSVLLYSVD